MLYTLKVLALFILVKVAEENLKKKKVTKSCVYEWATLLFRNIYKNTMCTFLFSCYLMLCS